MNQLINYFQDRGHTTIEELTGVRLVILAFICYSITRLVVTDTFPLFANPREWFKKRFPPTDYVTEIKPTRGQWKKLPDNRHYVVFKGHWFGDLIDCPWCSGFWVSLGVWSAYFVYPVLSLVMLMPMALRAWVGTHASKVGG